MKLLVENWYVFWGIGATIVILRLHVYARRHPEMQFASHWERLRYAAIACAVFGGIAIVLNGMLQGFLGVELFTCNALCVCYVVRYSLVRRAPFASVPSAQSRRDMTRHLTAGC